MVDLLQYLKNLPGIFPGMNKKNPWNISEEIQQLLMVKLGFLKGDYAVKNNIAIHKSAVVEEHVVLKGPIIVSKNCFIGAHAYLRGGVFLDEKVSVGPGCEVKSSLILRDSALAHFNFVGDSLLGSSVNLEAGSVIANHYNERNEKTISVMIDGQRVSTGKEKFGAVVGDFSKIGANAVLSPGTILSPYSIVNRLTLVEQCK